MSGRFSARCLALALLILVSVANAYADIYGSISGTVRDNSGNPLPGVTVSAAAPVLPKARDTVTESNGTYLLPSLPPGTYTVNATLAGLGSAQTNAVVVAVDRDTAVDLRLSPTVSEAITVTAAAPTVDMKSTEVNYNYDAKTIERLPLPRTYQGLFQLAPGIAAGTGFAPVAGGGRQENSFLLDGNSVTNPLFGYVGIGNTDTNELDIADFNVKRGAGRRARKIRASTRIWTPRVPRRASAVRSGVTTSSVMPRDAMKKLTARIARTSSGPSLTRKRPSRNGSES